MKITVDLPDELLVAARKRAAEQRTTLDALMVRGLRKVLAEHERSRAARIEWVVSGGGLPPGLDLSSRESLHEWLRQER